MRTLGISNTTFVYAGYYYQNLGVLVPFVQKDNEVEVIFPYLNENDTIPMIDIESDIGVRVYLYIYNEPFFFC
jgi:hypothetical protein